MKALVTTEHMLRGLVRMINSGASADQEGDNQLLRQALLNQKIISDNDAPALSATAAVAAVAAATRSSLQEVTETGAATSNRVNFLSGFSASGTSVFGNIPVSSTADDIAAAPALATAPAVSTVPAAPSSTAALVAHTGDHEDGIGYDAYAYLPGQKVLRIVGRAGEQQLVMGGITHSSMCINYTTVADHRLVENVTPIEDALATVAQLKPVEYTWNTLPDSPAHQGFVAHELQSLVPQAVTGEVDALGIDGMPSYQGVDAAQLVPLLTAAIQQLLARVTALEDTLAQQTVTGDQ